MIKMIGNKKIKKSEYFNRKINNEENLFDELHKLILKIAIKYKINIYDAYVILGYMLGCKKDYYKKAE